jgi:tetratricopeptide (TPR) repeat protein
MVSVSNHERQASAGKSRGTARFLAVRALFFFFLAAFVTSPITGLPRQGNITVTGTVTLPDGNPAVHIKVKITGQTGLNFDTMTDNSGRYQFQVPAGRYRLSATNPQDSIQYTDPVEADTGRTAGNRVLVNLYLREPPTSPRKNPRPGVISLAEASQQIPKEAKKAFDDGLKRKNDKQTDKALESFNRAIDSYPGYFQAFAERGEIYITKNQIAEAIEDFGRCLKLNEDWGPALRGLGFCYLGQQKFADAIQYLERAIQVDPSIANTHLFLGIAALAVDRRDEARQALQESLKIDSRAAITAHIYLADLYAREEKFKDAANELRTFLDARPDAPNAARLKAKEAELRALAKKQVKSS